MKRFRWLNFLAGKHVDEVNKMAELGTQLAHVDGGVPNIKVNMPEVSAFYIGQLFYFFEKACGISGYMLGVNPFNQPGVEAYKKNMFALLNKRDTRKKAKLSKHVYNTIYPIKKRFSHHEETFFRLNSFYYSFNSLSKSLPALNLTETRE